MELSSCCGAPVTVEFVSDDSNFSDDEYELKVPVRVCSLCGKVQSSNLPGERGGKNAAPRGPDPQSTG